MDIRPIRTESDYLAVLTDVKHHFDAGPDPAGEAGGHFEVQQA